MITVERDGHARQCSAKVRSGKRCRAFAVLGATVCRMHGGASPQARAAAERRLAELKAEKLLGKIWDADAVPVTDVFEAMQRLAGQLTNAVDQLGRRINDDLDGVAPIAWGKVIRELRQLLLGMERLDLDARRIELAAGQADMVATAIRAGMEALGPELLPDQRDLLVRTVIASLRSQSEVARAELEEPAPGRPRPQIVRGPIVRGEVE